MKLLATDLDGTFIKDKAISEDNLYAIYDFKDSGNKVAIATGRPLCATKHLKKAVDYDFAITANGSMVTDSKGKVLFKADIDQEVIKTILNLIDSELYICYISNGYDIVSLQEYQNNPINDIIFISVSPISKKQKDINEVYNQLSDSFSSYVSLTTNGYHLDIGGLNCTKATGISVVVKKLKIQDEDVMVFGDQDNDISMFEEYKNSYYIYGGSKKLRKLASNKVFAVSDALDFKHPFDVA